MSDSLWFKEEQLLWFDELNPDYFVEVGAQQMGEDDFREDALLKGYRGLVLSDEAAIGWYPVESCHTAALFKTG